MNYYLQNKTNADMSLQRQTSLDLSFSDISSVSDVVNKLQLYNLDVVGFAQENIGVLISVSLKFAICVVRQSTMLLA